MKRFTTVSLLLAGLIVSCTARNIEVDNNRDRGSSSSEEFSESMELKRQLEAACYEKTGSNQAFEAMLLSEASARKCFYMQWDTISFRDLLNASKRHVFFPKYCPHLRNVYSCFEWPVKKLRKCLDDDFIIPRKFLAALAAVDFVCENDGEILFRDETNEVCKLYTGDHFLEILNMFNYKGTCNALVSGSTKIMAISKYGETQCGEISKVRDCMSKRFNKCNGSRSSSFIVVMDVYLRAMFKDSPCRNLAAIGVGSGGAGSARHPHELVWHFLRICLIFVLYMLLICIQHSTINVTG